MMRKLPSSDAPRSVSRRWRRALLGATATLAVGVPLATIGSPSAEAATPTAPPPVSILTSTGDIGHGDIFVSPFGDASTYANGPEILDARGNVVWFQPVPAGEEASDFRTQTYEGQPVLTWWQGTGLGGLASGTDYIYNDHYQQLATVNAGNGLSADGHEFLITPQNTALILSYTTATADALRLAARPGADGQRRVHVLRQRVLRHTRVALQPRDHGEAERARAHRDTGGLR